MGVRGLTTYIAKHSDRYLEPHTLHDCSLIVDGNSLAANLYNWHSKCECAYGGDYDGYSNSVTKFFIALKKCGVRPLVIFDGGYETKKLRTVMRRLKVKIRLARSIRPSSKNNFFPLLMKEVFKDVLLELNIAFAQCFFEADDEIAAIARRLGCPVLSYDSDFYVYDVLYIPFSTVHTEALKTQDTGYVMSCSLYSVDHFLNNFGGMTKSLLPLMATLLGNDYIKRSVFKNFYTNLKYDKRRSTSNGTEKRIVALLAWLENETVATAVEKILLTVKKHYRPRIVAQIRRTIKGYTQCSSELLPYLGLSAEDCTELLEVTEDVCPTLHNGQCEATEDVSPTLHKGQCEATEDVSPTLHKGQCEATEDMSPTLHKGQCEATEDVSPTLHKGQCEATEDVSPTLHKGQCEATDDVSPTLQKGQCKATEDVSPTLHVEQCEATEDEDSESECSDSSTSDSSEGVEPEDTGEVESSFATSNLFIDNLPKWFKDRFTKGNLPSYFIDMLTLHSYFCSPQIEDYSLPLSHLISLPIIGVIFSLLTGSKGAAPRLTYYGRSRYHQPERLSLLPLSRTFPPLGILSDLPYTERLSILGATVEFCDDDMQALHGFPAEWRLFIVAVIYWVRHCREPLLSNCHIHALMLSVIALSVVDKQAGYFRSKTAIRKALYINGKNGLELKKHDRTDSNTIQQTFCCDNMTVADSFAAVMKNDCIVLVEQFLPFHSLDQRLGGNPKLYSVTTVHAFAQLQSILFHLIHLNALLSFPLVQCRVGHFFSGTFVCNAYDNFKKRSDVNAYIENSIIGCASSVCRLYKVLVRSVLGFLPQLTILKRKGKKKQNRVRSGSRNKPDDCGTHSEEECIIEDTTSYQDSNNRFGALGDESG